MSGHPKYKAILDRMWELHCEKAKSYGALEDPLANLRNGERFGVPAWLRCLVEADSAFYRLENYCNGRNPSHESLVNALMDTAAFSMLALLFVEEERERRHKEVADAEFELHKSYSTPEKSTWGHLSSYDKPPAVGYREPSEEIGDKMKEVLTRAT